MGPPRGCEGFPAPADVPVIAEVTIGAALPAPLAPVDPVTSLCYGLRSRKNRTRLYRQITPGVWIRASKAALWVNQTDPSRCPELSSALCRPLCDAHFEFRGGDRQARPQGARMPPVVLK